MFKFKTEARGLRVCCYHGLVHERRDLRLERNFHVASEFRRQMQFLRRQSIIPLGEAAESVAQGRGLSSPASVITFDDGYANNLLAAEILSEAKSPWTIFLSVSAIAPRGIIWTVELSLLLLHGQASRLEALGRIWALASRAERESAFQDIRFSLKAAPATSRQETMNLIRAQFSPAETERLLEQFPIFQMLSWPQIRQLAASGVEIGSHGVDHEIHHAAQEPEVRRRELVESKKEIERQIGKPCRFFAFPNGDTCEDSAREVEEAGYEMAFTTRQGFIGPEANRFLLPRISPGGSAAKLKQQWRELRRE